MSLIERAVANLQKSPNADSLIPNSSAVVGSLVAVSSVVQVLPEPEVGPAVLIDFDKLNAAGYAVPGSESWALLNQLRVIKRPLISNAFGQGAAKIAHGNRIQITSALPGEGKSFCAVNLALSLTTERDCSVLLVDADMARPSLPTKLGCVAPDGLMDALIDQSLDIRKLVHTTSIPKLNVLFSGRQHKHATEFLASTAMVNLLEQISRAFANHLIVFDSPPLLPTTESRELASHMGQIVLVVEAGRTPRTAVRSALATLEKNEVIGLVLNKWRKPRWASDGADGQYGYGYGYGYNESK